MLQPALLGQPCDKCSNSKAGAQALAEEQIIGSPGSMKTSCFFRLSLRFGDWLDGLLKNKHQACSQDTYASKDQLSTNPESATAAPLFESEIESWLSKLIQCQGNSTPILQGTHVRLVMSNSNAPDPSLKKQRTVNVYETFWNHISWHDTTCNRCLYMYHTSMLYHSIMFKSFQCAGFATDRSRSRWPPS